MNLAETFTKTGAFERHELVKRGDSPHAAWDVVYYYANGTLTSKSVGGMGSTAYEWKWEPKPAARNLFTNHQLGW